MLARSVSLCTAVLFVLLSVHLTESSSVSSAMSSVRVSVAACRVKCLNQIGIEIYKDGVCESTPNCNMCWKTCEMFYNNFTVWGPMCDEPKICFPGCQVSCAFYRSRHLDHVAIAKEQWDMDPIQFRKTSLQEERLIEWTWPERLDEVDFSRLVYVVMLKANNRWVEIGQTIQTSMLAEDYRNTREPTFISLLAYTEHGLVAERSDVYNVDPNDAMYGDQYVPESPKKVKGLVHMSASPSASKSKYSQRWTLNLAALTSMKSRLAIEATIAWEKPAKCQSCKNEVSWKVQDSRYDVIGTLYTSATTATLILWPGYVHAVKVKCFNDNGSICDVSESISVDTNHPRSELTVERLSEHGSGCRNTLLLEVLVVTVFILVIVFLICLVICIIMIFRHKKIDSKSQVESG